MDLNILPLAITMMAGPQIIAALVLVTTGRAVRVSLAFLVGVAVATTVGVVLAHLVFTLFGNVVPLGDPSDSGSTGNLIQFGLVALLIIAAVWTYLHRATAEPPRWLTGLMEAGPSQALTTGLMVILLMPSDIIVMLTVGAHLAHGGENLTDALAFIAATVLVAALPLIALLAAGHRARDAMPTVRDWLNSHSWVVTIATCLVFVLLLL
ncbi:GAP family protein [Nocardiopsis sp. MG754419]|uniref:GAP family protein n=1 Tax=Nocardiopsis sp. MG754419 TaxID=2259865 RepID=UPI001BAD2625|nr:GAP family protein [Nocardiopsis sp. MG754419]MBR8744574.1 GAP family protein [Nocardiopsis sp. MG754419]